MLVNIGIIMLKIVENDIISLKNFG